MISESFKIKCDKCKGVSITPYLDCYAQQGFTAMMIRDFRIAGWKIEITEYDLITKVLCPDCAKEKTEK